MNRIFILQPATDGRPGRQWAGFRAWRRLAGMTRLFITFLAGELILATGTPAAMAENAAPLDYQVKAAYLVNFPKYLDWPAGAFADTNSPITVAILGDADVANEFANMIQGGKTIGGHPIVLQRITKEEEIRNDFQVLFIATSERSRIAAILEKVKGSSILTVGESDDFLEKGGIINLVHRDRKIRLKVNLPAAEKAHLKISSRLLVVAEVMKDKPE
jgi:hypothetical protein